MSNIKVDSGGGSVSSIVGGDIRDVTGVVNLGEISGDVTNAIGGCQMPKRISLDLRSN